MSKSGAKKRRPRVVSLKPDARCAICEIDKPLDTCHILPQRLFTFLPGADRQFLDYDGINTFVLCKNHHALYDSFKLSPEDFQKIWLEVHRVLADLMIYLTNLSDAERKEQDHFYKELQAYLTNTKVYVKEKRN